MPAARSPIPAAVTDPDYVSPLAVGEGPGLLERLAMLPDSHDRRADERFSMVPTWVVSPEGPGCRVRLETALAGARAGRGVERLFAPRVLRRPDAQELQRLDRYARTVPPG
jgi:hypothetical protein